MDMAREREMVPKFRPFDLSIDSRLARKCMKTVPVGNLFFLQRTERIDAICACIRFTRLAARQRTRGPSP